MTRASDTARLIGAGATINDGTTITTADNTTQLTLTSTDADGSSGPLLDLTRDSGSPADGDVTGIIRFRADNDAGEVTTTGQIVSLLNDASDGTEDGEIKIETTVAGSAQPRIDILPGETVFNEGSIDVDFRVEGNGEANLLVVNAGDDKVGIGTDSPNASLEIDGNNSSTTLFSGFNALRLHNTNGSAHGVTCEMNFTAGTSGSNRGAAIGSLFESNASGNDLYFATNAGNVTSSNTLTERVRISAAGLISFFKTSFSETADGVHFDPSGLTTITRNNGTVFVINRQAADGTLVDFRNANSTEGTIGISGSTVSYNGFSGLHESSGIASNVAIGTVVSTIDELDVYPSKQKNSRDNSEEDHPKAGQTRADHAKIKISDSVGDKRVYGVLQSYDDNGKPLVASVGIGSIRVTGACEGGDLLESNGDGTAKVQSDDIIRSKTIGKVTIGNSSTDVKLVSCVLYCG